MITVKQYADKVGITKQRVLQLIKEGHKLYGVNGYQQVGRGYILFPNEKYNDIVTREPLKKPRKRK